ncbi:MAG: FG-GAP repeat protein [Planctomycetota bacterium]|jgi:hypothetical protein|nr:FG-GAP repeat protein [Planctomycetota bacterium]MDP6764087.1 FG-GAP repeat protein [Planctomycetota bacterium]MDP6989803.1 FG-GAP repeat protein [Planctomycetota bacterium]
MERALWILILAVPSPGLAQHGLVKLTATDGAPGDVFGTVAVHGERVLVGADQDDDHGSASGAAYVFDADTGEQLLKLTASDGAAGDRFGGSVGVSAYGDDTLGSRGGGGLCRVLWNGSPPHRRAGGRGGDGALERGPARAGGWSPGAVRRFQVWYADAPGPCGTGFNLSNGLEIRFGP